MAFPTSVNDQVTDAVAQANVKVLGDAPAQAMGMVYQTVSQAMGLAAQNATAQQQSGEVLAQAATSQAVALLLSAATRTPR
ncbi:MAG: RebB family R body protein [Ramlibacter sp.]|nr:RebB family R body protein [Ramlibacter sp.]